MKAIVVRQFGAPDVLRLEEVPDPKPGDGQVVVSIRAVGVNPFETYARAGNYGPKTFPYTPGVDAGGIVESVGSGVTRVKPGDRVYTAGSLSGTYAQKALCSEATVHRLPDHVTFEQGAALGVPYATAHRAMFLRGQVNAGESMLIHGASGGVGIAAVQFGRAVGLTVIGTAGTAKGRQLILEQGAHHALDHRDEKHLEKAKELAGGQGVDIILEMLANVNLGNDLAALSKHGRVVVVGNRGKVEINPRDLMARDADIRGMTLLNATEPELAGSHAAIIAGLETNTLRPIIGERLPLPAAAQAHERILEPNTYGKLILTV